MLKRLAKTCKGIGRNTRAGLVPAIAAATALLYAPASTHAHTARPDPFKEASITFDSAGGDGRSQAGDHRGGLVELLVGHDGDKSYTHLKGHVTATFRLRAKVKSGHRIYGWVVTTGDPEFGEDLPDDLKGATDSLRTRSLDTLATFSMDANTAVNTAVPGISFTRVQEIIDKCNAAFPGDLPDTSQTIDETIDFTVHAGFAAGDKRQNGVRTGNVGLPEWFGPRVSGRPAIAENTFPVSIVCAGKFRRAAAPMPPRAGNTLHSIDLKVSQKGERCPKDVTVTAYANYKWQAKSRMRMTVSGGRPKMRVAKTKKLTFAGKTFHCAEAQFNYKLDPGQKTFTLTVDRGEKRHSEIVEITCPPFKVTSAWLKYDVEDTPTCPRKVTETATYHTTRPGWVDHEIRMQGGLVVSSGKLTSKRVGDKYVATAVRNLTLNAIDKEFMADAVDYPANSGWVPLQLDCPRRNVKSGSNDIKVAPKPSDAQAKQKRLEALKAARAARLKAEAKKRRKAMMAAQQAAEAKNRRKAKIAARKRANKTRRVKRQAEAAQKAREQRRRTSQRNSRAAARVMRVRR